MKQAKVKVMGGEGMQGTPSGFASRLPHQHRVAQSLERDLILFSTINKPAHLVGVLMAQGAAGIGGRAEVEVVDPHVGCELEAALGRQALVVPAKDQVAQASASWPCWRPPLAPDRVGAPGCPELRPASAKSAAGCALASGPVKGGAVCCGLRPCATRRGA